MPIVKQVWLGDKVLKDIEKKAAEGLLLGALEMESDIKSFTPAPTGNLKNSIASENKVKISSNKISVNVGTDVVYAAWVEYGGGTRKDGVTIKFPPRAMFRKGAEKAKPKIDKIMKSKLHG